MIDIQTIPLTVDNTGGLILNGSHGNQDEGRCLALADPRLWALDLHDDPNLEVLDLRGCASDRAMHLQLDRLPALRELWLPETGRGAVIHVFQLQLPVTLTIHGRVSEIDADWQSGTLRSVRRGKPWHGVKLLGSDGQADFQSLNTEVPGSTSTLNIVLNPGLLTDTLCLTAPGDWLLIDASPLQAMRIDGPRRVDLRKAARLETLQVCSSTHVRGEGLDTLHSLDTGTGQHRAAADDVATQTSPGSPGLTLQGNMTHLCLGDRWSIVQLRTPRLESLRVGWLDTLDLHNCSAIKLLDLPTGVHIHCEGSLPIPLLDAAELDLDVAQVYINELTLQKAIEDLEAGDQELLPKILKILALGGARRTHFRRLAILLQLARKGLDLQAIWACRCTLLGLHMPRRSEKTPQADSDRHEVDRFWDWNLPREHEDEGLQADLQLWALCQTDCPRAKQYRDTLIRLMASNSIDSLPHLVHLVLVDPRSKPLTSLLEEILLRLSRKSPRNLLHLPKTLAIQLPTLSQRLPQMDLQPKGRLAVIDICLSKAPWEHLGETIQRLFQIDAGYTRAALIRQARNDNDWLSSRIGGPFSTQQTIDSARQQLTRWALMPVREQLPGAADRDPALASPDPARHMPA